MKSRLSHLAAMSVFAVACLPSFIVPAHAQGPVHQVGEKSMADRWGDAFNKGDLDALVALYTEDAELLPNGTQAIKGHDAIRSYLENLLASRIPGTRTKFSNIEVFGTGDAFSELADVEKHDNQGHVMVLGRQILVVLRKNGRWLIHRDMWTNNKQGDA